jgi:hypothetical protein
MYRTWANLAVDFILLKQLHSETFVDIPHGAAQLLLLAEGKTLFLNLRAVPYNV